MVELEPFCLDSAILHHFLSDSAKTDSFCIIFGRFWLVSSHFSSWILHFASFFVKFCQNWFIFHQFWLILTHYRLFFIVFRPFFLQFSPFSIKIGLFWPVSAHFQPKIMIFALFSVEISQSWPVSDFLSFFQSNFIGIGEFWRISFCFSSETSEPVSNRLSTKQKWVKMRPFLGKFWSESDIFTLFD